MNIKLNPKKSFGQNFLTNKDICKKIVNLLDDYNEKNILEIGPGHGALTDFIYQKNYKSLTLVEKDNDLIENLKEKYQNANIINKDALKLTIKDILATSKITNEKIIIIGNLPYNVGTILILNWILECDSIDKIIVMLQKEVAQRFTAKEKTKDYGIPTILSQKYYNIKIKIEVSPNNFFPKPKVDSAVLVFERKKNENFVLNEFLLVKEFILIAFQNRRKKLKFTIMKFFNNKNYFFNQNELENDEYFKEIFEKRIEEIPIDEIFNLSKKMQIFSRSVSQIT